MSSNTSTTKIVLLSLPLVLMLILFFTFLGYVSYSLHAFYPKALVVHLPCKDMNQEETLMDYVENRTVIKTGKVFWKGKGGSSCWSIKQRWYMPIEVPDIMEVSYALYMIRVVSKDYEFFEEVLASMYSPIHFYCFPMDANSTEEFQYNMRTLGECVINIIVPDGVFNISNPSETFRAHAACFHHMQAYEWKHAVVNQENEIPIQSIHYIADSMRRLGDASRIGRDTVTEEQTRLLREDTKENTINERMHISKAACWWLGSMREPLFISRAFADTFYSIVLNEMTQYQLEHCQMSIPKKPLFPCTTERYDDHNNCILGMENLGYARNSKNLFVRAVPQFDFGFAQCVHEFVFHRTYNMSFYNIHYGH